MKDRYKPSIPPDDTEYALLDTQTNTYQLIGQGFGVCDRVADSLNFQISYGGEVQELADQINQS